MPRCGPGMRWAGVAIVALGLGCVPAVAPDEARSAGHEDSASRPAASEPAAPSRVEDGPLELVLDGAPPQAVAQALPRAPGREVAGDHAERAGWAVDGRAFVHCRRIPDRDCHECRAIARDGTSTTHEHGPGCGDAPSAEPVFAPEALRWSAGTDVVLVLETREHETTNAGEPRPMLKLGARRREGGSPAWLLHVDPCQGCGTDQVCAAAAHLDALALSPDGRTLAVLIHQSSPQGEESTRVELLSADRVAAVARTPATPTAASSDPSAATRRR